MSRILAIAGAGIVALLVGTAPVWAVGDLTSVLIRAGEAPPTFGAAHVKAYHHFVRKMTVTSGKLGTGQGTASCDLPTTFARDGWTQGIIQSFDGPSVFSAFELCASLFSSAAKTHTAFLYQVTTAVKEATKQKGLKIRGIKHLGAEAEAVGGTQQGFAVWILTFRHDNAIIDLSYIGPANYGYGDLLREARRIDSRTS